MEQETTQLYARLLAALRSGKYKQTTGRLFDGTGYCCLGVADIAVFGAQFVEVAYDGFDEHGDPVEEWTFEDDCGQSSVLAAPRASLLGLNKQATAAERERAYRLADFQPLLDSSKSRQDLLTMLNDSGLRFELIADFIEACGWHETTSREQEVEA